MWKKILIGVAVLVVLLVIVIATRPSEFTVSRTATIPAPAEAVFPYINDLHKWQEWSPWAKLDPNAKMTYAGPDAGKGASATWAGNMQVGEGTMTIAESKPNELVRFDMQFVKPFKAESTSEFILTPKGEQTEVKWSMSGKNNFIGKAMSLCMNCDKMVGGEFEKGLANLAGLVKAPPKQETATTPATTL